MIRVLICDDQVFTAEGLKMLLETYNDISVEAVVYDGDHALQMVAKVKPDIVLMDLKMRGMTGIQAIRHLKQQAPDLPVLALTTYDQEDWIVDAIMAGAAGFLLKDASSDELVEAIRGTVMGKFYIDPAVAGKFVIYAQRRVTDKLMSVPHDLTEREVMVLKLIAQGLSNQEIGAELHLSEGTIKNYTTSLFRKIGVKDRTQAALKALQYQLNQNV